MAERPVIGEAVHFVGDEPGQCRPMFVHHYLGTASLRLADVPPPVEDHDPLPERWWVAVPSDTGEPHSWHPPCEPA
jgi:hypothetical protein